MTTRRSFARLTAGALAGASFAPGSVLAARTSLHFAFRSGFWSNLHHRLYLQSQAYEAVRRGETLDASRGVWDVLASSSWTEYRELSPAQRAIWERALKIYATNGLADQDLLGGYMPSIDGAVSAIEDGSHPATSGALRASTVEALSVAGPVYRATLWHADDAANRAWIDRVTPLVAAEGARLTARLAAWYRSPWPTGPYRVDVTRYANWAGCYTNVDPIHIVMSSRVRQ